MNVLDLCKIIEFKEFEDDRGKLVAIESFKDIPFGIKRIFYIYGSSSDSVRGQHANKKSEFVLINLKGSCKIRVYNENEESIVLLNKPNIGLYVPKLVWKDMFDFSEDSLLLVLSNEYFNSNEYIRKDNI